MTGKNAHPENQVKETVARHLRAADIFAKEGHLDNAMLEVQRALSIDPKNYYARSFQERIRAELEKIQQKESRREQKAVDDDEKRLEIVSRYLQKADELMAKKNYSAALQEVAQVYKIDSKNYFATSYSDRIEMLMVQESASTQPPGESSPAGAVASAGSVIPQQDKAKPSEPAKPITPQTIPQQGQHATGSDGPVEKGSLSMYRQMLKEMWFDGKITAEEDQELEKTRKLFNISQQEHEEAEKQVHVEAYVDALKIAWRDGVISPTENVVLEMMRQKYNITLEEHMSAEAQILWAKNNNALTKGTILIVDDDRTFLLSLAAKLKKHGYEIVTADKIEKAIKLLDLTSPQLVLSDLMFGPGEMTGLEFYQHVRSHPKFRELPFLLMSGISDEFVFRAGVRMGVSDFLAKPFSLDLLLATIAGKLSS